MKAAILHAAHDLRIEDVAEPELEPGGVRVRVRAGGICGSDLHYFQHGGFGTVRLRQPMVPGHEIAGEVMEVAPGVTRVRPGDIVAVDPSRPCRQCRMCLDGKPRHCLDMLFYGSAMRFPHVQGGFREQLVCTEAQAVPAPGMSAVTVKNDARRLFCREEVKVAVQQRRINAALHDFKHAVHEADQLVGSRNRRCGIAPGNGVEHRQVATHRPA